MRKTFVDTLSEMARKDNRIMCVIGDTGFSVFEEFEREFGDRFVNVGIAEQNFVGFGAGLAAMGMKPYIYNVASFMVYRAFEEIELDVAYQNNPVVLVGVGGGHAYGTGGPTHHAYFDIAMMRLLPNMTVVCPGDPVEMREVMLRSKDYKHPMYIRIGRNTDPVVHTSGINLVIGKAIEMRKGDDAVLYVTGVMLKDALKAAEILERKGIIISVYSMHTIKPIDKDRIRKDSHLYPHIFTLEEHGLGGLGTAIGEVLMSDDHSGSAKLTCFSFPDIFAPFAGTREFLNHTYGLGPEDIAIKIEKALQ
ncbi:transketolase subunit B [Lachnospiraceae bacterium KHCPX20]|nr:transketolase subunit B [Lachnospiraceae bacterium KHCPX20]